MKNRKPILILAWILALLPLLMGLLFYSRLPAQIPTHWGFDGQITYSSKSRYWILAALPPVLNLLFFVLPKLDPLQKNYARFQSYYDGFQLLLMAFLAICANITLSEGLRPGHISVERVVVSLVGFLFLLLGNWLPKFKSNSFIGIRTPWTLSDPDIWNRSHRLAGRLLFIWGEVLIPIPYFLPQAVLFWLVIIGTLAVCLLPCLFSYVWFRQKYPNGKAS